MNQEESQLQSPPYALPVEAVLQALGANLVQGMEEATVAQRRARLGPNELVEAPPIPMWRRFLAQFKELVIWILIAAAVISGALGEWTDTLAILAIVLLNALLGFYQEERAQRALAALKKLSAPLAKVVRGGALHTLPARELTLGDSIRLEAGDHVPADSRLAESFGCRLQEASLTGESTPVDKDAGCVLGPATPLGDRRNMIYLGTVVAAGKASAVVTAIGMETELGRIAGMLRRAEPEPTPLQRRMAELGKVLVVICLILVAVIFALQLLRGGKFFDVFLISVSLAVAAVPEGLPAVVTIALALGLQRMVKRHALVRKLPSVETLGSVTVICSDKTGTLTRNEMTVRELVAGGTIYHATGVGYAPRGEFRKAQGVSDAIDPSDEPDLIKALTIGARCNNARVRPRGDEAETWEVLGDPTEGALIVAARKAGIEAGDHERPVLREIPFDSERKAMSVVERDSAGQVWMYTKGAPEVVLHKCTTELEEGEFQPLTADRRREILEANAAMAARALRVLGLAYRPFSETERIYPETELIFAGLVGMIDPPREEVKEAVRKCREAGIRPVMITGDHPATAQAIARELGIAADGDRAVTGQELDVLTDDALAAQVGDIAVYARVTAEHKLRVVRAWKGRGQIVAMTGDGVNDAPAVRAADIGIAMGLTGTDVTREASDMVLTDDNFASIVNAVEEGRGVFDNIQKSVHYLLAGNIGLLLFIFFASLVGWPFPLVTTQILWINLVTNGLPALGLGVEPPERDLMRRQPRRPREPVITLQRGLLMLLHGSLVGAAIIIGFALVYQGQQAHLFRARSVAFCLVAFTFIFYSFSCRSLRYTMPELGLFSNPPLLGAIAISAMLQLSVVTLPFAQTVFESAADLTWEWGLIVLLALTPVTIIEVAKLILAGLRPGSSGIPPS